MADAQTVQAGAARVTLLNAGDMALRLADELAVPEEVWRPAYAALFERRQTCPSLSVLIELEGTRVLVDANDYRATVTADSPYALADYTPPPGIPEQLGQMGVRPEDIAHVVLTHAHWDHYAGTTQPAAGGYAPTYPRARYYLGAAEWEDAELRAGLGDPATLEGRTLGVLDAREMLERVAGPREIAEGITVLPAPGETPGHQIVRVRSRGETVYVLGDLFHAPVEVERPEWMVTWADAGTMLETRRRVLADALAESALLVAAHIFGVGRLERAGEGVRWRSVDV